MSRLISAIAAIALLTLTACGEGRDAQGDVVCDPNSPDFQKCVYQNNH